MSLSFICVLIDTCDQYALLSGLDYKLYLYYFLNKLDIYCVHVYIDWYIWHISGFIEKGNGLSPVIALFKQNKGDVPFSVCILTDICDIYHYSLLRGLIVLSPVIALFKKNKADVPFSVFIFYLCTDWHMWHMPVWIM